MTNGKKITLALTLLLACMAVQCGSVRADDNSTFQCGRNLFRGKMYKDALRYFKVAESTNSYDDRSFYYEALCYHQMGQMQAALSAYQNVISKFPNSDAAEQSKKAVASMTQGYAAEKSGGSVGRLSALRMDQIPPATSVPATEVDGKPVVEALVSGVKIKFVVDTKAADTTIGAEVAKQSKLPDGTALKKSDKDSAYFLHEIKLGSMVRTAFPVRVSNNDANTAVLGANFFESTSVAYDPKANALNVKRLASFSNPFESGMSLFNKNRLKEAYPLLKKAAVDRPSDPRALYTLAVCAHRLGKVDEARTDYRQVLARFPGSEPETYASAALMVLDPAYAERSRLTQATNANQLLGPALKETKSFDIPYTAENGNFKVTASVDGQNVDMYFVASLNAHIFSTEQIRRIDPAYLDAFVGDAQATPIDPGNQNNLARVVSHDFKIKRVRLGKIEAVNTSARVMDSVSRYGFAATTSPYPILAGDELLRGYRWEAIVARRVLRFTAL